MAFVRCRYRVYDTAYAVLTANHLYGLVFTYNFGVGISAKAYVNGALAPGGWTGGNGGEKSRAIRSIKAATLF